ncbi:multicopper oxidase domain-containing protein [Telmatocola sphagniphila]|uniref:Multicopper oxidase domain-containing protein n=1 Tax=Telmatocola sphagniphila TaxID=1123043 RepID=A0A8E6B5Z9_9BACT|nr:multicopper oxidase domain-containing protein [Telmatocola sphagniphila]QVL31040.1 multicopper oxidase domain-containing protein [Telmatocola sphagniphila]
MHSYRLFSLMILCCSLIGLVGSEAFPAQPPDGKKDKKGGKAGKSKTSDPRASKVRPFQDLWIPPILEGKTLDLSLAKYQRLFLEDKATPTYGYNGHKFWGPTLILNQDDTVRINVKNELEEVTTVHWHGLHLPAATDGGPHQLIQPGETWSPTFTVKNNAGTYWYHPHPHEKTQKQLTLGAGGLIIIRDPIEAKIDLPRTYGIDDIPLVLSSRRFKTDNQFSYEGDNDKYGDFLLANGTMDAQISLPAQFVRLRILNAEIERGYELGFADNRTFYQIATDGGLVEKPVPLKRLKLMVGERVELLVDLSDKDPQSSLDLMAYNAGQSFGFPGGEPDKGPPNGSYFNDKDFRILRINLTAPTQKRVTKLPETLTVNRFPSESEVSTRRNLQVTAGRPRFSFDNKFYDMHSTNQIVKLGAVESWTITNNNIFGHSFHIHDVQFKIVARGNEAPAEYERGWKDTVYLPRGKSVTFLAKFEDYASDTDPFMYHCHMANHEDGGMMGQFLVSKNPAALKKDANGMVRIPDRSEHPLTTEMITAADQQKQKPAPDFRVQDISGQTLQLASLVEKKPVLLIFIERDCPCSRESAGYFEKISQAYSSTCSVVGVINAETQTAQKWAKSVGCHISLIADPNLKIIRDYQAERSVYTTLIAPGGKIEKTYPGYSTDILQEISLSVARLGRVTPQTVSFEGAPKRLKSGCPFVEE